MGRVGVLAHRFRGGHRDWAAEYRILIMLPVQRTSNLPSRNRS